jgi:hypothetical protein
MAELFVMCPECGLRDKFTQSQQQLEDPGGQTRPKPVKVSQRSRRLGHHAADAGHLESQSKA